MTTERPLMLVTQGCCQSPSQDNLTEAFAAAGSPVNRLIQGTRINSPDIGALELSAIEGRSGRSFIKTTSRDVCFPRTLYEVQLDLEGNRPVIHHDIVLVICHPPEENQLQAMSIVVQLTSAGHRVHSLIRPDARSEEHDFGRYLAAGGIWSWLDNIHKLVEVIRKPQS